MIRNLIFHFNESEGDLVFKRVGTGLESHSSLNRVKFSNSSSRSFEWSQNGLLYNFKVAQVSYVNVLQGIHKALDKRFFIMPCNLDWNSANNRRFSVSIKQGKCLRFIATSYGDIFVVFATNPQDEWTWYTLQISSYGVALYKVPFYDRLLAYIMHLSI